MIPLKKLQQQQQEKDGGEERTKMRLKFHHLYYLFAILVCVTATKCVFNFKVVNSTEFLPAAFRQGQSGGEDDSCFCQVRQIIDYEF